MLLSVIANRSHSGFRAAVYGIHFDPWGFDTLLYFVKMLWMGGDVSPPFFRKWYSANSGDPR